jgi:hypothetical protein
VDSSSHATPGPSTLLGDFGCFFLLFDEVLAYRNSQILQRRIQGLDNVVKMAKYLY